MKPFILALALVAGATSIARAADLSMPIPPPYVPPAYNWTGFYLGGNLGVGWDGGSFVDPIQNTLSLSNNPMFLGGAQVGLNYQFSSGFLIGVEADFDWLSKNGNGSNTIALQNPTATPTGSTASVSVNNRWLTTVTGRVGYAWDRVLFYGKGGGAWLGASSPNLIVDGGPVPVSLNNGNWGFTGGVGIEWAFLGNWSARLEYDFVGLNQSFSIPGSAGGLPAGDQFTGNTRDIQLLNAGINYRFAGW